MDLGKKIENCPKMFIQKMIKNYVWSDGEDLLGYEASESYF